MAIPANDKKHVGGLLLTGLVSTVALGVPDGGTVGAIVGKVAEEVIKALAPNFAHQFLSSMDYGRLRDAITNPHPDDLNHDLEKLVADALRRAVGYVNRLYLDRLRAGQDPGEKKRIFRNALADVEEVLRTLEADLQSELAYKRPNQSVLQTYLLDKPDNCFEELTTYLFRVSGIIEQDESWADFRAFFRKELPRLFDLSFREALKDTENDRAFKAFHLWLLEEGYRQNQQLLAGQATILHEIELLKAGHDGTTTAALREQFERDVQDLKAVLEANFARLFEQLDRMEKVGIETRDMVQELLDRGVQLPKPTHPHHLTFVPHPGFVTGREALLADIHEALQTEGTAALVRGVGGIGKTTAALAYLHHAEYGACYDHIAWLEILTTLPDAFAGRRDLHERLGIRPAIDVLLSQNDLDGIVYATLDALRGLPGQVLLALDNANDRDEIRHWKRALTDSGCRLLITSRADVPNVTEVPVGELDPANALVLFYHHYRPGTVPPADGDEADAVTRLLDDVQSHTLLLEMLGKIGKQARMSAADLRQYVGKGYVFSKKLQRTVATSSLIERKGEALDETTLENLVLFLFRGLAPGLSEPERTLLRQVAVLPPTLHAPALLARLFGVSEEGETDFFNALDGLDKRGVPFKKDDAYQLHRLVRAVALRELTPTPSNCAAVLNGVANLLRIDQAKDNPIHKFPFVSYGEALLEAFETTDDQGVGLLQNELAIVYRNLGDYERARDLLEAASASDLKNFGPDHPNVATHQSNLAIVYGDLGDYERARDLLEAASASDLKNFGPDHPTVAVRQSNLANVYRNLGKPERARDLLEAALASDLKNFGPDHPNVATHQSNLANVYRELGNYERARELAEAALASALQNFGADHPAVALYQSVLAHVEAGVKNWLAAKILLQKALSIAVRVWGEGHPHVRTFRQNIAFVEAQLQKN